MNKLKLNNWVMTEDGMVGFVKIIQGEHCYVQVDQLHAFLLPIETLQIIELTFKGWAE